MLQNISFTYYLIYTLLADMEIITVLLLLLLFTGNLLL